MGSPLDALVSYVSPLVIRRIAASAAVPTVAAAERFPAAVLFADLAGFTPLAERLAQRGATGAEEISRLLNAYFDQVVADVSSHGGYVLRFAGDALLAVWPADGPCADLAVATLHAVQCARVGAHPAHWHNPAVGQHATRFGVGAGEMWLAQVGGVRGRWESVAAGDVLVQAIGAQQRARPGEIVVAPPVRTMIDARARLQPLSDGFARVEEVHSPAPVQKVPAPAMSPGAAAALRAFVPETVLSRLDAAQPNWLAELRRATMLFVHVSNIDYTSTRALDDLQAALASMQEVLARYEGTVRQLVVDDKGTVFVGAFGVPPCVHEDDPTRAVEAAFAIRAHLDHLRLGSAVGIATGQAFCGPVGGAVRREYAMIGDVVNLAARLMGCAEDGVLCDAATYRAARC